MPVVDLIGLESVEIVKPEKENSLERRPEGTGGSEHDGE